MKRIPWGLVFAFVVLGAILLRTRERMCPLSRRVGDDPLLIAQCAEAGGVLEDGECTCPE
jgi:hypothetical protein